MDGLDSWEVNVWFEAEGKVHTVGEVGPIK